MYGGDYKAPCMMGRWSEKQTHRASRHSGFITTKNKLQNCSILFPFCKLDREGVEKRVHLFGFTFAEALTLPAEVIPEQGPQDEILFGGEFIQGARGQ